MPKDMVFTPVARSLITRKPPVTGTSSLNHAEEFGTLNLRLMDEASCVAASKALGVEVPKQANTFASIGFVTVLWLGPDEWLVHAPHAAIANLQTALETALVGKHTAVTDVSDHSVAMVLSGEGARRILEKGCPLDLHPRVFSTGSCAQSHFLQAVVILAQLDQNRFLLRVRRSMSEYLWDALADAIAKG
ncbi:sarcosine oxidase subunit gamma family protein (plasmid) [Aliisedimentitalea scapharcae]|uniref:Sarcosine oxidase subunit gamma family protein n=1 Tax=Aliisedimentitalea scapharcae TaxID=1524259 RepID=A0ABZ2Y239_9RHOB